MKQLLPCALALFLGIPVQAEEIEVLNIQTGRVHVIETAGNDVYDHTDGKCYTVEGHEIVDHQTGAVYEYERDGNEISVYGGDEVRFYEIVD